MWANLLELGDSCTKTLILVCNRVRADKVWSRSLRFAAVVAGMLACFSSCTEKSVLVIAISQPTNNSVTSNGSLIVSGIAATSEPFLRLEVSVNSNKLSHDQYSVSFKNGSGGFAWSVTGVPLPADTTNQVTITPYDTKGQEGEARSVLVKYSPLPKISVTVTTVPPGQSAIVAPENKVTLTGTVSPGSPLGIQSVAWVNSRGGKGNATLTNNNTNWSAEILLSNDENQISIIATDTAGNTGQTNVLVIWQSSQPVIAFEGPAAGGDYESTTAYPTIRGVAAWNVPIASIEWKLNGSDYQAATPGAPNDWSHWTIPNLEKLKGLKPGFNSIAVRATDQFGQHSQSTNLLINYTQPEESALIVNVTSPWHSTRFETRTKDFALGGTVYGGDSNLFIYWSENGAPTNSTNCLENHRWTIMATNLQSGDNRIHVTAGDSNGKVSESFYLVVKYTPTPTVTIEAPTTLDHYSTTNTNVDLSGIVHVPSNNAPKIVWTNRYDQGETKGNIVGSNGDWNLKSVALQVGDNTITLGTSEPEYVGTTLTVTRIDNRPIDKHAQTKIQKALDDAQASIDEFGTISVSTPVLESGKADEFIFALTNGPARYFNDALSNTQGSAATFSQSLQSFSLGVQAQVDPTVTASYLNAAANAAQQEGAYQLQQQAYRQAADAQLLSTLQQIPTNATLSMSNQAAAAALQAYAQSVYTNGAPPTYPVASTFNTNLPQLPTNLLPGNGTNALQLTAMRDFLGLLSSFPAGLSIEDRSALITAAGDNAIESFFRALGNSSDFTNFVNSEMFFGLTTVSINPGWRTKSAWAGEVDISVNLLFDVARRETILRILDDPVWPANVRARVAKDKGYPYNDAAELKQMGVIRADEIAAAEPAQDDNVPVKLTFNPAIKPAQIMIISPLIESQTFNLADSARAQQQVASYLSAACSYAGLSTAAQAFKQFAASRQSDIATRTPIATVNAFSGPNGSYGFQIGPRLQALDDSGHESGGGSVLERQSFPALILLSFTAGDVEPRLKFEDGKFMVYEPYVTFHQIPRWITLKHFMVSHGDWYKPYTWFPRSQSESHRLTAANGLEDAEQSVGELGWKTKFNINGSSYLSDSVTDRIKYYEQQLVGSVDEVKLPYNNMVPDVKTEDPEVTNVRPDVVQLRLNPDGTLAPQKELFVLRGNNMDAVGANISTVYSNAADIAMIEKSQHALTLEATVTNSDYPLIFQLPSKAQHLSRPVYSMPVILKSPQNLPEVLDTEPHMVTLSRGSNGAAMLTNIDIIMVGTGLRQIDLNNAALASGYGTLNSPIQLLGDGLKATVTVTNAGQAVALRLPIRSGAALETKGAILSAPVEIELAPASTNSAAPKTNAPTVEIDQFGLPAVSATTVSIATNADPQAAAAAARAAARVASEPRVGP